MVAPLQLDPELKKWATARQAEYIDAVIEHGSARAAARVLGCNPAAVQSGVKSVRMRAAMSGYAPEHGLTKVSPAPFVVKGTSTLYDAEGNQKLQWVKTKLGEAQAEAAIREYITSVAESVVRAPPAPAPDTVHEELLNLYTMTDCHMGMLAWRREGGEDWDMDIAKNVLTGCFEQMVMSSPPAKIGFVNQLGDWLHYDSLQAITPTSGHLLDADSRFEKVVSASIAVLRRLVDIALSRHETVIVLMAEGNHDIASSVWLRALFRALYENEPRIQVIDSPLPYYAFQHGKMMLGFHHGHLKKFNQLPALMAAQFSQMWGETKHRVIHTGHYHHERVEEHPGVKVMQHPTLAARDAYAARGGWISERQATAITYHSEHGQVGSVTVTPEMLKGGEK